MVEIAKGNLIDFSFVPSLDCNLNCPFCMYDAGHHQTEIMNMNKVTNFVNTVDWSIINSIGLYGGEPSINLPLYQQLIYILPITIPKFIITNGAWSSVEKEFLEFLDFVNRNDLHVIVSGTPYHKQFQNQHVLNLMKDSCEGGITLKGDDKIYPMGRAKSITNNVCTQKCKDYTIPTRMALFPNGNILFQNCDGSYPIIQTIDDPFKNILEQTKTTIKNCLSLSKNMI